MSAVIAPIPSHEALRAALQRQGLEAVDHVHELADHELPLFGPEAVKGLEFDGVIVVSPHEILSEDGAGPVTARGVRLLYVAMTRAVQELHVVTAAEPPAILDNTS